MKKIKYGFEKPENPTSSDIPNFPSRMYIIMLKVVNNKYKFKMKKLLLVLVLMFLIISCEHDSAEKPISILVIGNSIVHHEPNESIGWYHDCGMAATSVDKDFAHLLKKDLPIKNLDVFNAGLWELTFNFEGFNPNTKSYDLIIIKLGENTLPEDVPTFETKFPEVVNFYANLKTKVIVLSNAWADVQKDEATKRICDNNGYTFCDISKMFLDRNKYYAIGEYENNGVAFHPNDKGHLFIEQQLLITIKDL